MQIQIEPHTLLRANERGASEEEIIETINSGSDIQGKQVDLEKQKYFLLKKKEMINIQ